MQRVSQLHSEKAFSARLVVWRYAGCAASAPGRSAWWGCLFAGFERASPPLSESLCARRQAKCGRHTSRGYVVQIEQSLKHIGVGDGSIGGDDFAHELVALADTRVSCSRSGSLAVLLVLPLGVDVFLRTFAGLPTNRHDAILDRYSRQSGRRWSRATEISGVTFASELATTFFSLSIRCR